MEMISQTARRSGSLMRHLRSWGSARQHRQASTSTETKPMETEPTETKPTYPSLQYPPPSKGFRPSQSIKQNRPSVGLRHIRAIPPPRSTAKLCPDPIAKVTQDQLATLDPTGMRTRLFAASNDKRVGPGDILLVRFKNGDPFSGVVLAIRQRHQPIDTAVLLRNQLTRVSVEMWVKVYSPNVAGIEIVQRKATRAKRAKLYYMRQPRHDVGSVENIVRAHLRRQQSV